MSVSHITDDLSMVFKCSGEGYRILKRKGEIRYVASMRQGSMKALIQFAPPSKYLPRLYLKLLSFLDFRFPGLAESIEISESFLVEVADRMKLAIENIGIYVGEPNARRKLVIIDSTGHSRWILKMAVGTDADAAIRMEQRGIQMASGQGPWAFDLPKVQEVAAIYGREAMLIERIQGRQLKPWEFEEAFFGEDSDFRQRILQFKRDSINVGQWTELQLSEISGQISDTDISMRLSQCRQVGALELTSSLGVVHGDFAPWNIIQQSEDNHSSTTVNPSISNAHSRLCAIDWEFACDDTPLIFDYAYAAWCYAELLGRRIAGIDDPLWTQLVSLGALWKELRLLL